MNFVGHDIMAQVLRGGPLSPKVGFGTSKLASRVFHEMSWRKCNLPCITMAKIQVNNPLLKAILVGVILETHLML